MHSQLCEPLQKQGYQFFSPSSSAAVKPCLWCKAALSLKGMCYKHQFYGIESHRCVQMTPTLRCNQRCRFCWRSFEHTFAEEVECPPDQILKDIKKLQKRALAGYKVSPNVDKGRYLEALEPRHIAISLSGEPTCYSKLPELIELFHNSGFTTFLVSNGTHPWVLERCKPYQLYISLVAPDRDTYLHLCRPEKDYWDYIQESLLLLGKCRSAIRITLVAGWNDKMPGRYASMIQNAAPSFVEVKGYMYLGYSRKRLRKENMPEHHHVRNFSEQIASLSGYQVVDENPISRVVLLRSIP